MNEIPTTLPEFDRWWATAGEGAPSSLRALAVFHRNALWMRENNPPEVFESNPGLVEKERRDREAFESAYHVWKCGNGGSSS